MILSAYRMTGDQTTELYHFCTQPSIIGHVDSCNTPDVQLIRAVHICFPSSQRFVIFSSSFSVFLNVRLDIFNMGNDF